MSNANSEMSKVPGAELIPLSALLSLSSGFYDGRWIDSDSMAALVEECVRMAAPQAAGRVEPSGPYGWRAVIADARMRLDNDHPSAYDNSGYRDFAGNVLDTVEDELSALEAALAPSAKEKLDQSTFEFSIWCAEWFGPDADDSYLAKAVRALPSTTQNFERPAQTAPQAQPTDALDAARYRYLRDGWTYHYQHESREKLDASLDAAMAAAQEGGNAATGKDGAA